MMKEKVLLVSLVAALTGLADFERAEVEWHFPLPNCHEGIPFGNAVSGFLVYGESNVLKVVVGRDDAWDHRGGGCFQDLSLVWLRHSRAVRP